MQTNKLITYSSQVQKKFWNLLSSVIKHRTRYGVDFHNLLSPSVKFVSYIRAYPENDTFQYLEDNRFYVNIFSVPNKQLEARNLHEFYAPRSCYTKNMMLPPLLSHGARNP